MTSRSDFPRLLMIANFLGGYDGRRSYAEDLIVRLRGRGINVTGVSALAFKPARLLDMLLASLGSRGQYDTALVDVYSGQAFAWAELVTHVVHRRGLPLILALRGGNLPQFANCYPGRVRSVLRAATEVIAPSSYLQEAFAHWRSDIRILPNAIDLDQNPVRIRSSLEPRLFWLRSFHNMYQPDMAVRVLARVAATHRNAHLTMAGVDKGDGSLQKCQQLAAELKVKDRIKFAGFIPKSEVGAALSKADIFLNTTTIDNAPVSVLEAMACGLCVVSTNAGGVAHLVEEGVEALLTDPTDEIGMVQNVLRVINEPGLSRRLSIAGQAKARQSGWDSILPRWLEIFQATARSREVRAAS